MATPRMNDLVGAYSVELQLDSKRDSKTEHNTEIAIRDCEEWGNANLLVEWTNCKEKYKGKKLLHAFLKVSFEKTVKLARPKSFDCCQKVSPSGCNKHAKRERDQI